MGRAKVSTVIRVNKASAKVGDVSDCFAFHIDELWASFFLNIPKTFWLCPQDCINVHLISSHLQNRQAGINGESLLELELCFKHIYANNVVTISIHFLLVPYLSTTNYTHRAEFHPSYFQCFVYEVWIRVLVFRIAAAGCGDSHLYS